MIYFILLLFILFNLFFLSSINPYTLTMIFGKKGSGKTTFIAKWCLKYIKQGKTVYSNVPIMIDGVRLYNPSNIGLYTFEPDSVVFCDEVGLIWHNRDYKNFQKCVIEWFKYQRQYKIKMYLFSQCFDTDKVLRDLTDKIYIISRIGKFSILRPVIKKVGISTDQSGNGQLVDTYLYGSIFDFKFTYIPRYVGLFASFNPPQLKNIHFSNCSNCDNIDSLFSWKSFILYKCSLFFSKVLIKLKNLKWRFSQKILLVLEFLRDKIKFTFKHIKRGFLCVCTDKFKRK